MVDQSLEQGIGTNPADLLAKLRPLASHYTQPGFLLRRAHQLSVGIFERHCGAMGLTPAQYGALFVLAHAGTLDQTALSRAQGFDKVTTLRIVRGLEGKGLVRRKASAVDGRKLELSLTPEGLAVCVNAQKPSRAAHDELLGPLTPEEQDQLVALLGKLCAAHETTARVAIVPAV